MIVDTIVYPLTVHRHKKQVELMDSRLELSSEQVNDGVETHRPKGGRPSSDPLAKLFWWTRFILATGSIQYMTDEFNMIMCLA